MDLHGGFEATSPAEESKRGQKRKAPCTFSGFAFVSFFDWSLKSEEFNLVWQIFFQHFTSCECQDAPLGFVHPKPKIAATARPKSPEPSASASATISGSSSSTWRAELPEAWKYTIRGLSLPMPGGPRIWAYIFICLGLWSLKLTHHNPKIHDVP